MVTDEELLKIQSLVKQVSEQSQRIQELTKQVEWYKGIGKWDDEELVKQNKALTEQVEKLKKENQELTKDLHQETSKCMKYQHLLQRLRDSFQKSNVFHCNEGYINDINNVFFDTSSLNK